ncbi:class III extradiol ring-cleavage dioxygenase [Caenispirillum bisanense]|uniref:DODA-type extradiol aromatic ring-opening family dioxygenase n=1 Tax=Caenispirillum bisanense TaxID=414052 RepID=UPI0031D679A1
MRPSVLFVSHGSPTLVLDPIPAHAALRALGAALPVPAAVLVISAHWETTAPTVDAAPQPATIHDFYGFPADLYAQRYAAPGAPALARRAHELLAAAGLDPAPPAERGLDHGAWVPLALLRPAADVPVFQVSVVPDRDAAWHRRLGAALAPLRDEGVMIVGSGAVTHTLRAIDWRRRGGPGLPWVEDFADAVAARVTAGETLDDWLTLPHAAANHPSPEHFLPLPAAQGAAGGAAATLVHRSTDFAALRMDVYRWE